MKRCFPYIDSDVHHVPSRFDLDRSRISAFPFDGISMLVKKAADQSLTFR
jgi:hypothetical protein